MAVPPEFKNVNLEQYRGAPDWVVPFFLAWNTTVGGLVRMTQRQLTRSENCLAGQKVGLEFRTLAVPSDTLLPIKNDIGAKITEVRIAQIARSDGTAITAAWSMSWIMGADNTMQLRFQGLVASQLYKVTVNYE